MQKLPFDLFCQSTSFVKLNHDGKRSEDGVVVRVVLRLLQRAAGHPELVVGALVLHQAGVVGGADFPDAAVGCGEQVETLAVELAAEEQQHLLGVVGAHQGFAGELCCVVGVEAGGEVVVVARALLEDRREDFQAGVVGVLAEVVEALEEDEQRPRVPPDVAGGLLHGVGVRGLEAVGLAVGVAVDLAGADLLGQTVPEGDGVFLGAAHQGDVPRDGDGIGTLEAAAQGLLQQQHLHVVGVGGVEQIPQHRSHAHGVAEVEGEGVHLLEGQGDALEVLECMIVDGSISGFHIFFPDPWQKKRHHKRRLVQRPHTDLIAKKLAPSGYLYFVTDWYEYAEFALSQLTDTPCLHNKYESFAESQSWRPETKFERRGLNEDRPITELYFLKDE